MSNRMKTQRIGWRKLAIATATLAIGSAALFLGRLEGGAWVTLALGVVGAYSAGNVGEHMARRGE